jgi:hypothetical protein
MKSELTFEQYPWDKALECIEQEWFGPVAEVTVYGVCKKGNIESTVDRWIIKLEALLGGCVSEDVLRGEGIYSRIAKYKNNAITRIFFDDTRDDLCENFEIVTKRALLVWKPDAHPQGRVLADSTGFCDCIQSYSFQLEKIHND